LGVQTYDWSSCTTEIFKYVQNTLFGYVWSQCWQAASDNWYISPAHACPESDTWVTEGHVLALCCVVWIVEFALFSSCVLPLSISGHSALRSIKTLDI
jgi:hypothetical protein